MTFSTVDTIVFIAYFLLIMGVGFGTVYITKKKQSSKDYFFASNTLPWWVIGSSVIAANISAEQFIGMTGSGYAIGLGIATYEWLGAIGLLVIAKFFLPIYLKNGIYTMPGFLEKRYDSRLRIGLAVFWLLVYWFVNLSSVFYLGALVLEGFLGLTLIQWIFALAILSGLYAVIGGLKAVAYTDVIQVIFLIFGGLMTTFFAIKAISNSTDIFLGLEMLFEQAPEKFDLILDKSNPNYKYLPGISVIIGGLWVANIAAFAALIAAIVSSLSSMVTSASTIFTFDIYKPLFNKTVTDNKLVIIGRIMSGLSLAIAVIVAPLLSSLEQAFQFIQDFTGMVTPGIVVVFLFGLFWKKANSTGALWTVILTIPIAVLLDMLIKDLPFLDRMGISFLILSVVLILISVIKKGKTSNLIKIDEGIYKTSTQFNMASILISAILGVLYYLFW